METKELLPQDAEARLRGMIATALEASDIEVSDQPTYTEAAAKRKELKDVESTIEDIRKAHTRPLDDLKKSITAYISELAIPVAKRRELLTARICAYDRKRQEDLERSLREQRRKEAEAAALAAIKVGKTELAEKALVAAKDPIAVPELRPHAGTGISYRDVWKFEVTEPAMVPDQFWVIDETALGKFVRDTRGAQPIPGVRIYSEKVPVQRG